MFRASVIVCVLASIASLDASSSSEEVRERFEATCLTRADLLADVADVKSAVKRMQACGLVYLQPGTIHAKFIAQLHNVSRHFLKGEALRSMQQIGDFTWFDLRYADAWVQERRKVIIPPRGDVFDELVSKIATSPLVNLMYAIWPKEESLDLTFLTVMNTVDNSRPTVWHYDNSHEFLKIQLLLHDIEDEENALLEFLPGCGTETPMYKGAKDFRKACKRCHEKIPSDYPKAGKQSKCTELHRVRQPLKAGSIALYYADTLHAGRWRYPGAKGESKLVLDINIRKGSSNAVEDMATNFKGATSMLIQDERTALFRRLASRAAAPQSRLADATQRTDL